MPGVGVVCRTTRVWVKSGGGHRISSVWLQPTKLLPTLCGKCHNARIKGAWGEALPGHAISLLALAPARMMMQVVTSEAEGRSFAAGKQASV